MFKKSVQQQLLSFHCNAPKKQLKNNKLNLFGKAIGIVDTVRIDQHLLESVMELDLSHNGIFEIENIEQFCNVEFVNLSHNKINEEGQVMKLRRLAKLHTLYVKGNPFLKSKMSIATIRFLLSLTTDIDLVSSQVSRLIETYTTKTMQNQYYTHYLHKIQIHIQLINNYQLDDSFINPAYAIFPKIKKIFEKLSKQQSIKRKIIEAIDEKYFEEENLLTKYLNEKLQAAENQRSIIIKKIYERQELLRNVRSTYNVRNIVRRTVPKPNNSSITTNPYFSPLKESKKQEKAKSLLKFQRRLEQRQNSPPKLSNVMTELDLIPQSQQSFINTLTKINSLYHLLHSPLTSLKSHEKDLLIQNLCLHLKQRMKEISRFQKRQQEYLKNKEENSQLQEYLKQMSAEVKNEQQKANEKLKRISTICQEQSERVENLCQELCKYKQELSSLKIENQKLQKQNEMLIQTMQKIQSSEKIETNLREKCQMKLKRTYFSKICHKAHHLKQIAMLQQINRKNEERYLKESSFFALRKNIDQVKNTKLLANLILKKHIGYLLKKGKYVLELSSLNKKVYNYLKTKRIRTFYPILKLYSSRSLQIKNAQEKITKLREKNIKRCIFNLMKKILQEKDNDKQMQETRDYVKMISLRKCLQGWKRVIIGAEQKEIAGVTKIISLIKANYLRQFARSCEDDLTHKSCMFATEDFLIKIRKIKCYLRFSRTVSSTLFNRGLRVQKVQTTRKHRYFSWFVSTIRDCQIKKKIIIEREMQLKKREEESAKQLVKSSRRKKLGSFRNLLIRVCKQVKDKIIYRQKAWITLLTHKQSSSLKVFIENLRSNWLQNFKISSKLLLFSKSPITTNKIKSFYKKFAQGITQPSVNKINQRNKLMKCFYRWKFFLLWQKMQEYKNKLLTIGPQITQVSKLQREIQKQKQMLLLQIEQKDYMMRDYQKKCEEYEYILHSKDLKYEKLKDIYADSMHQQELNATIKIQTREAAEEDIYKKYLPLELKNKYSYKIKNNEEDKYSNLHTKYELPSNSNNSLTPTRNRGSFISSFKRF